MLSDYLVETFYPHHWHATRKLLGQGWFLEIGALRKTFHMRHRIEELRNVKDLDFLFEVLLKLHLKREFNSIALFSKVRALFLVQN